MAKNEVQIKFNANTSGFNEEIKKMNSQITATRAALKLNAEQMKNCADKTEFLKERQKLLATELSDAQTKTKALSDKLEEAKELFGEDSAEVDRLTTQLYNAQAGEEKIKREIEETNQALEKNEQEQQQAQTASNQLTEKISEQEAELDKLKQQYVDATLEQGKNSSEAQELAGKISSLNDELNENKNKLDAAQQEADELTKALDDAGNEAEQATNGGFTVFKGILADLASQGIQMCISGLKDFAGSVMETGMNFEAGMSQVKAIVGTVADSDIPELEKAAKDMGLAFEEGTTATETAMNILEAKASEMGQKTKFTSTEAAEAMNYMAMAGWEAGDMISGIDGIMNLAAASGEDLAKTSDIVTDALTAFGMEADEAGHFADILAATSSSANTNVSMMGESFKQVAPIAGSLSYSAEDTSIALGIMANSGIKASQGGTALKNILTNLVNPTETMQGAMDALGISLQNEDGSAKSLMEVMQNLRDAFGECSIPTEELKNSIDTLTTQFESGEVTEEEYNAAIEELTEKAYGAEGALKAKYAAEIAGKQGMAGLLAITNATEEDFNALSEAVNGATDATTGYSAANEMAKDNQDNLKGDIELMQSAFDGFKQSIYKDVSGPIREVVQGITSEFIPAAQNMYEGIKEGAQWLGEHKELVEGVAIVIGSLTAGIAAYNIVTGIKAAMEAAETTSLLGLVGAQIGLNTAMLTCPLTWIIAGITAAIAIVVLFGDKFEGLKKICTGAWEGIKNIFSGAVGWIKNELSETKKTFEDHGGGIEGAAAVAMRLATAKFRAGYDAINKLTGGKLDTIVSKAKDKFNSIKESAGKGFEGIKNYAKNKLAETKKTFEDHGGGIEGAAAVAMKLATAKFQIGYDALNTLTKGKLGDTLKTAKEKFNGIKDAASDKLSQLKTVAGDNLKGVINTFKENGGGLKGAATAVMKSVKDTWEKDFKALNTLTGGKLLEVVDTVKEKLSSMKEKFQEGVNKIKEIFNFKLQVPSIKMPQITVTYDTSGTLAKAAKFLGLAGMPKFGIKWNAEGAILTQPTIFGFAGGMLQGGGEAGKEAVLPIDTLQDYIENSMAKFVASIPQIDYDRLGKVIVDSISEQDIKMEIDRREVGRIVRRAPSW